MDHSTRNWLRLIILFLVCCGTMLPCTSGAQTANIAGEWEYDGTTFTIRQDGAMAYGFLSNNLQIFKGSVSQTTWHGQRLGTGLQNAKGRCPEGEGNVWLPFELTLTDGGSKMVGKYRNTRYAWDQSGPINCWVTGYQWDEMTIYSLTPLPMPESLKEQSPLKTTMPASRITSSPGTSPQESPDQAVRERKHESRYPSRSCTQCGNALLSSLAAKVEILGPWEIREFLSSARTKYSECIKGAPGNCEDTSVYWKNRYGLETCYNNFPEGGDPLKACIFQVIYQ